MENENFARSLRNGFLAGLAGGLAGAVAKAAAGYFFPPETKRPLRPAAPADAQAESSDEALAQLPAGSDWVAGTLTGGVYGAMVELKPSLTAWRGAAFGLTLKRVTRETLPQMANLKADTGSPSVQARISAWAGYVAYGVALEMVRRRVRRGL